MNTIITEKNITERSRFFGKNFQNITHAHTHTHARACMCVCVYIFWKNILFIIYFISCIAF